METNCVFSNGQVKPVVSNPLPTAAANLVYQNCVNIDTAYEGIKARDLFREMCENTRAYLDTWFDLDTYFS